MLIVFSKFVKHQLIKAMQQNTQNTIPNKNHQDIPVNPSTATSSPIRLNDHSNGNPLKLLSEEDWDFLIHNGYVIIKNAISKEQAKRLADHLWEFEGKDPQDIGTWYEKQNVEMKMKELTN